MVNLGAAAPPHGLQAPQAFLGAQGLQAFFVAQGLQAFLVAQGLQAFFVAHGLQAFLGAQGLQAFLVAHGLQAFLVAQGLQAFLGAQGLQAFLVAQGLQSDAFINRGTMHFCDIPAADAPPHGLHGLQAPHAFFAPQGLQAFLVAQGLHGLQPFFLVAHGLHAFFAVQAATWYEPSGVAGRDTAVGLLGIALLAAKLIFAIVITPADDNAAAATNGMTVEDRSLLF